MLMSDGCIACCCHYIGVIAPTGHGAYGTAKAALIHLTKIIAVEEAPHGVRANCISPGAIATDMLKALMQQMAGGVSIR